MSFSHWMSELRTQDYQRQVTDEVVSTSPVSLSSSWAETDSESDSDSQHSDFVFFGDKLSRKMATRKNHHQRTPPILIPQSTHTDRTRSSSQYCEESPVFQQGSQLEDYRTRHSPDINEEDLMLFGNLAYFRTQHGDTSSASVHSRSIENGANSSSNEDEEIFDMEM